MNEDLSPLIISVVSGKGGVGKTSISISLAKILSKNLKVLLIDFDLHNQGLTHLLGEFLGKKELSSSVFAYINNEKYVKPAKLEENLYFITASKRIIKSQEEIENINKNHTAEDFRNILLNLAVDSKKNDSFDCIIIDNTGIPDDFSIGSSLASDKVLLVTQTDSVTWRGALNFHRIFQNNKGDTSKIDFIINNIPKKYSYELIDLEVNKIGEIFKNLGFTLFIPFEYGIFESFDNDPFGDKSIEESQFYRKIKLLAAIILKEFDLNRFISKELEQVYNNQDEINRSLSVKFQRYSKYRKGKFTKMARYISSMYFALAGTLFVSIRNPEIIPSFIREIDPSVFFASVLFLSSLICLILPDKIFSKLTMILDSLFTPINRRR